MGNSFRRFIAVVLLITFGAIVYLFVSRTGGARGLGGVVTGQALLLFGGIFVFLYLYRRFGPRS